MKLGIVLVILFGVNLIFSLFFTFGESFVSNIPAIIISVIMIIWGIWRIRKHNARKKEVS